MRVVLRKSLWHFIILIALCVLRVPTVSAQECAQNNDDHRADWAEYYADSLGDGKFLDRWEGFPGCWELPKPGTDINLNHIKITEDDHRILISSPRTLFLDTSVFGELAYGILTASLKNKSLIWDLDSYGGWLEVTMVLLDRMQKLSVPVDLVISENSICYSACLILAAGIEDTYAHPKATFGFHGATLGDKYNPEGTERYLQILIQMGVSPTLLETLREQGVFNSDTFYFMSAHQLTGSGLFKDFLETI